MDTSSNKHAPAHKQFERDGYAIFRDVLDPDLVQEASSHVDWLLEKNPDLRPEHLHHRLVREDPFKHAPAHKQFERWLRDFSGRSRSRLGSRGKQSRRLAA